jgi:putative heme-binding domain-containing protein
MYNFGHVAVSGSCFWRSYSDAGTPDRKDAPEHFLVTHFNTQRLVRMELTPSGSTYKAVENEFLKLHNPDIHLTDVMEDKDGSLLLIDTGGWFRIGCPSSLMAKSDLLGAVYRIKPKQQGSKSPESHEIAASLGKPSDQSVAAQLSSGAPFDVRRACDAIAIRGRILDDEKKALSGLLASGKLDPTTEHSAVHAAIKVRLDLSPKDVSHASGLRCYLRVASQIPEKERTEGHRQLLSAAIQLIDEPATNALNLLLTQANADDTVGKQIAGWSLKSSISAGELNALTVAGAKLIGQANTNIAVARLLAHQSASARTAGLNILASQTAGISDDTWLPLLDKQLAEAPTPLLLDAIKKLKSPHFDAALQAIASDTKRPPAIRLKALDSAKSVKLTGDTFEMVKNILADATSSSAAKIQAAGMLAAAPIAKEQMAVVAPLLATVGPVELKTLLPLLKRHKDVEIIKALAREIAKNPAIASQQESLYRTALADLPPEIFETIILPAYNTAVAATEAKKRQLGPLAEKVIANGKAANGEKHFKAGKGTCIACHKIGDTGRAIGPDLSHIGAIRTERDLLESILFPSNTLARDYEAHIIETSDGQQTLGVIKSHTAEGLLVLDIAGQEKNIPHQTITGDTTLTTSLMPMGLDQTLPEDELLDLVAWLRSLR